MDGFTKPNLTKIGERYYKKVQSEIEYCLYCQPYDDGDAVWIMGDRTELYDLFIKQKVPEDYWDIIMSNLHCPNCGNSEFSFGLDVGVKNQFEKDVDKHMDEVYALYGSEVRELEQCLESFPLLAYQNKLAKRIYKEIKDKKLPTTTIKGKFFRSRKVENSEVISYKKMYCPPLGKPLEGRFNHSGQSHLYLASNKETSIKEVFHEEHSMLVWYQEFEILEEVKDVLDLSFDWINITPLTSTLLLSLKIYNTIGRSDRNINNWKPDYYLTRYIMDCAKKHGCKGIKYNSVKDTFTFDVVFFFPDELIINPIGNPCIEIFLNKDEKDKLSNDLIDLK